MNITDELLREFDCLPVASSLLTTPAARRAEKKREQKRLKIVAVQDKFADLWDSENRPKTKQEAVALLTPMAGYVLSLLFNMLSRRVIEWLWDRYTAAESRGEFASVTVSAENVA